MNLTSRAARAELAKKFEAFLASAAKHPALVTEMAENVEGDYVFRSKNIFASFDINDSEDLRFCYDGWNIKDCRDTYQTMDKAEQQYETHASSVSSLAFFCNISHENHDIQYCDHCFNSKYLFGCVGVRNGSYCILNREYEKNEFLALRAKIIEHMRETGEYGEFFPASLSPYGYNETTANDYYPLTANDAIAQGFQWSRYVAPPPDAKRTLVSCDVPDDIHSTSDQLIDSVILCEVSGKPYRINAQELALYRRLAVPVPTVHPDIRAQARLKMRNSRTLKKTECGSCKSQIVSTREQVLCKDCYHRELYSVGAFA